MKVKYFKILFFSFSSLGVRRVQEAGPVQLEEVVPLQDGYRHQ
jgi:hypothetical protein